MYSGAASWLTVVNPGGGAENNSMFIFSSCSVSLLFFAGKPHLYMQQTIPLAVGIGLSNVRGTVSFENGGRNEKVKECTQRGYFYTMPSRDGLAQGGKSIP